MFKDVINEYGRQIAVKMTIENTEYLPKDFISCNIHYDGALYTSVMKCVDIELEGIRDVKKGQVIENLSFGVRLHDNEEYEYINFGNFLIKECEYDQAGKTLLECYDLMVFTMIPYIPPNIEYPVAVKQYFEALCGMINLPYGTNDFTNSEVLIEEEKYDDSYTFRDVLSEIAQVAGGSIAIRNGSVTVLYPNQTEHIIDEENLKALSIGKKFGPVTSIVLSREPQEDNIYRGNPSDLNESFEVKIANNQIMDSHREDFIDDLFLRVSGLEYYTYELTSFGIGYIDFLDMFLIENNDGERFPVIMLQDSLKITQGVIEDSSSEFPSETKTEYAAASKTDRVVAKTILRVDKQEQEINALVQSVDGASAQININAETIQQIIQSVSLFESEVENENEILSQKVSTLEQKAEGVDIFIEDIQQNGINKITTTTGYSFGADGLDISKTDSEMSTRITEDGMTVDRNDEPVLTANSDGVNAMNITVRQYLTIGTNSRFEDYDYDRTGCFYVGGAN